MNPKGLHLFEAALNQSQKELDWREQKRVEILNGRSTSDLTFKELMEYARTCKHSFSLDKDGNIIEEKLAMPFQLIPEK